MKVIKYVPFNIIKVHLLRVLFDYSIGKNVRIGKSIINCDNVFIGDNVYIANNNTFSCKSIRIGNDTKIHSGNRVIGRASFVIGNNSRIINDHFFDVWNNITIGDHTWIAGKNSQFWTHGSVHTKKGTKDLSITIGNYNYIGSACLFSPGVIIKNVSLIGLGSVVSKTFSESEIIIMGNPCEIIKKNIDWRVNW
ncbi:hypothetical protein [Seonamhaeicola sp.]|uniref:acyltransferase n=1 Tax=Seonamhaeicola sp. TaxID=1912245 RepID=UPI003566B6DC